MGSRVFFICDVAVGIECSQPRQLRLIQDLWQRLFVVEEVEHRSPTVCFQFDHPGQAVFNLDISHAVYRSPRLSVFKTKNGFVLQCGSSTLVLDLQNGRSEGVIDEAFWHHPLEYQREYFLLSLLMLLRPQGLYGLHANALLKDDVGCLIIGPAGSGKTTLTLALVHSGWSYLSDDALMLREGEDGVEALALRRGFSCTQETVARFPELSISVEETPDLADGKKLIELDRIYPDRFARRSKPGISLFPEISGDLKTRLRPMGETQAMVALLEQSPGIMTDKPWVINQMAVLKRLVHQTRNFQLFLGTDVYDTPGAVAGLLRLCWEK